MTSTAPTMGRVGGRLRLAVAGAVVLTALTAATTAAAATTMGEHADASPRSLTPGFLLDRGRYTTLEVPGATVETAASGINNRGQIVGVRLEADETFRGFVLERGRFRTFAAPGAAITFLADINNRGQIVGATASALPAETAQGFLLARGVDGPVTPVSVPGAPSTVPLGLYDRGQITGGYTNPNAAPGPPPATAPPTGRMG
jgi:hypothetical protein